MHILNLSLWQRWQSTSSKTIAPVFMRMRKYSVQADLLPLHFHT